MRSGLGDGRFGWAQECIHYEGPFRLWLDGRVVREGRYDAAGHPTGTWVMERTKDGVIVEQKDFGGSADAGDAK